MSLVCLHSSHSATPVYETTDWAAGYTTGNLSQSIRLVRKWVAEGALEIVEIGTQDYRITRDELNRFIKERQIRRSRREKGEDS